MRGLACASVGIGCGVVREFEDFVVVIVYLIGTF